MPQLTANSAGGMYPLFGNPIAYEELRREGAFDERRKV